VLLALVTLTLTQLFIHADCCLTTGDFIYEYGPYGGNVRTTFPLKEVVTLLDYRQRYAHYMGDSNLQRLRQVLPWIGESLFLLLLSLLLLLSVGPQCICGHW
jgi:PhoD-like phosphatase